LSGALFGLSADDLAASFR